MKFRNRIFDHSQAVMKDAIKSFAENHKSVAVFEDKAIKGTTAVDGKEIPNILEVVKRIEDFALIIKNGGFDVETQSHMTLDEITLAMDNFVRGNEGLAEGEMAKGITKDFSLNTLGFVVQQTITRLVSMMDKVELEAWMYVSREMVLAEGTVIYNVVVGNDGHATTRVAEGGEYNTFRLESTEDYIKTSGGKVGIMAMYSEEAARRAGASAIALLTEAALADMKRFKSVEALNLLEANAKTYYDGLVPEKMPSGRSYKNPSEKNGTLLMRDMETFFADTQAQGFDVDVIFINPLAYSIFLYEPSVRAYFEKNANVQYIVPKKRETIHHNFLTKMTKTTSGTSKAAEGHEVIAPNLITNKKLNIIVTPIVKFHKKGAPIFVPATRYAANKVVEHAAAPNHCADLLLIDSSRALTYVHDGRGVMADKIENRLRDVTQIKFKAYYSFLLDKDHGVFAFRNIHITDDIFDPIQKLTVTMDRSEIFPGA